MRFPEVRPPQPLGPCEGVVEMFLGGVILVSWSAVVFSNEPEESRPLVLPDSRRARAGHHDLLAVRVAGETVQQVPGAGLGQPTEVITVLVTDVTLLTLRSPGSAGQHVTPAMQNKFCLLWNILQ